MKINLKYFYIIKRTIIMGGREYRWKHFTGLDLLDCERESLSRPNKNDVELAHKQNCPAVGCGLWTLSSDIERSPTPSHGPSAPPYTQSHSVFFGPKKNHILFYKIKYMFAIIR